MKIFDQCKLNKMIDGYRKSSGKEVPDLFIAYCAFLLDLYDRGKINEQDLGIKIINATRSEVEAIGKLTDQNKITDEILEYAGNLDGYDYDSGAQAKQDLEKIRDLVLKYKR